MEPKIPVYGTAVRPPGVDAISPSKNSRQPHSRHEEMRAAASREQTRHNRRRARTFLNEARSAAARGDAKQASRAARQAAAVIRAVGDSTYHLAGYARSDQDRQVAFDAVLIATGIAEVTDKVVELAARVDLLK